MKSFTKDNEQKNIMSVVIKRDGLNISISTHEERESQILSKIKKAGVLKETASDDGTVHDKCVADTTRVVSLIITEDTQKVKTIFDFVKNKNVEDKKYNIGDISEKTGLQKTAEEWKPPKKEENKVKETETEKKRVFGTEYKGFLGVAAIKKLLKEKQGFIQNAFKREDIGSIDIVYGQVTDAQKHTGYGLIHILDKHPDITPEIINTIIEKGKLENTYNGYNIAYNDYIVGINKGYKENGKYVTTDNWIVTSFKKGVKGVNDTIAYAVTFISNTVRSENPFTSEIIIDTAPKVKTIFERVQGTVFDRYRK